MGRETTCLSERGWDLNLALKEDRESFGGHMGAPVTGEEGIKANRLEAGWFRACSLNHKGTSSLGEGKG